MNPIRHILTLATVVAASALTSSLAAEEAASSSLFAAHERDAVQWQAWSPEAVSRAESEGKPLFFFAAHYGNSLARAMLTETFLNQTIAETVNQGFVPVLIDVNEQPELASLLSRMAEDHFQSHDWPICLWTTSELAPIAGGGYFPPTDDWGSQGFLSIARKVAEQWEASRGEVTERAASRLEHSLREQPIEGSVELLKQAIKAADQPNPDAPQLPAARLFLFTKALPVLDAQAAEETAASVQATLERIIFSAGFDPISGGFFIGSNDPNWRLPLFQKSTADQALMMLAISLINEKDPRPEYADVLRLTADFIERSLDKPNGLAIRYLDSFAIGESPETDIEGSPYLFDADDLKDLAPESLKMWGLDPEGNLGADTDILGIYTGLNIPFSAEPGALSEKYDEQRKALREIREAKAAPLSDATAYTATNALLVQAFTAAYRATGEKHYLEQAQTRYRRLKEICADPASGSIYNSDAKTSPATSHDYAAFVKAALDLHGATEDSSYLKNALQTTEIWRVDPRFAEGNPIALQLSPLELEAAVYRDLSLPSVAGVYLENLARLSETHSVSVSSKTTDRILADTPAVAKSTPERYLALLLAAAQEAGD